MFVKCSLNKNLTVFKGECFPYETLSQTTHKYEVVVGIGGNVGDVKRRFNHLFYYLRREKRVELLKTSTILKNPPFGFEKQNDFFNAVIVLKTSMSANIFLDYLMRVEKKFGRTRSFANAPRTLDLDIIFFDDRVINTKKLTVPHFDWFNRESVVIPLAGLNR